MFSVLQTTCYVFRKRSLFTAHFCSVFLFVVSPRLEVPNLGMIIFHSVLTVFC